MAVSEKMKKRLKKELIEGVVCIIVLLCVYFGCEAYINNQVEEWNSIKYIGVSNEDIYNDEVHFKTVDEIIGYEFKQELYSSRVYYNKLNKQEKLVYDTINYAYENNITHLFFEEELISDCNYSLEELLKIFALDSPLVEQNLVFGEDKGTYTINNQFLYRYEERELKGSYINIENFTRERAEKKQKAVKQAKKIKLDFTDDMTEYEKARVIYDYLGENIKYVNDDSENQKKVILKTHYLYDALCKNETNCDGFANAFSLLCSLNGIKSFEKMNKPEKDEIGHTWNTVQLDDVWYNVDATGAEEVLAEDWSNELYSRFAFSDKVQTEKPMFSEMLPQCKKDSIAVGCTLKSCDEAGSVEKVAKAYRACEEQFFTVVVRDATNDEINDLMQDVAYYIYEGFETVTIEGESCKLVYINK